MKKLLFKIKNNSLLIKENPSLTVAFQKISQVA